MTWDVFLGIVELASVLYAVWKISASRAKIDADNAAALRELSGALKDFKGQAVEVHNEMWGAIGKNTDKIDEHDRWILKHDIKEGKFEEDGK